MKKKDFNATKNQTISEPPPPLHNQWSTVKGVMKNDKNLGEQGYYKIWNVPLKLMKIQNGNWPENL